MGNTCKPMAVSFQCMTKFTTNKKKEKKKEKENIFNKIRKSNKSSNSLNQKVATFSLQVVREKLSSHQTILRFRYPQELSCNNSNLLHCCFLPTLETGHQPEGLKGSILQLYSSYLGCCLRAHSHKKLCSKKYVILTPKDISAHLIV